MIARALDELTVALGRLDMAAVERFVEHLGQPGSRRLFLSGQGRSGLAAHMGAMRFMHVGFETHVVGETTAPSVRSGDTLILVSGSGKTPVSLSFAQIAAAQDATVLAVTHQADSPLVDIAAAAIVIDSSHTVQFGGTLFEQAAIVVLDSIAHQIAAQLDNAYDIMLYNHTNLQ